jgi:hypothetical protein
MAFLDWARRSCMHLDGGKVEDELRVRNGVDTGRQVTASSSRLLMHHSMQRDRRGLEEMEKGPPRRRGRRLEPDEA